MTAAGVPDLAARRAALDPARSFIVQAPAGSGKTELLIQRYLGLLACVRQPEEIVAITFTRKAAAEMRERVLGALLAARAGGQPGSEHERTTLELAAAALARDGAGQWGIADNPARLRIQTIDSLCAALTRQMPVLSGFGAQPESIEDAAELYAAAARATVELIEGGGAAADDVERLLSHLDNDVGRAETLIAGMLRRRDHWLRHVHGLERDGLESALRGARHDALARVRDRVPPALRAEWKALADYVLGNLGRGAFSDDVDGWSQLARAYLKQDGEDWRQRLTRDDGFPAGSAGRPWKARAAALFAALEAQHGFRAALADLRRLPPERYSEAQWEVLGAITRLLPVAVGQLKLAFQARGRVDFTEVAQRAVFALGGAGTPSELALALDYRIRHLLVDEFQDTSISQFELVAKLTAGWEPGDGRTVFVVGDPMQSIYRFREAEVGLFLRARHEGIGDVALEAVALHANFRSQAGIVEWVNRTFARVMPQREDIATGAVPYTASAPTRDALPGAAVTVHPFFDDDRAGEARAVAELVAGARREHAGGTVAILARNRGHLHDIVPCLKAAGLRFRAIEIEPLGHRPVVQDLLALTRALAHAADRMAWLAVLRAPWCGLTLADLERLAGGEARGTLWERINDGARLAALSADGRARLERVRAVLRDALDARARGPLRARVAGVWFALAGPACVDDVTDLEDAEIYFDHLEAHEDAGEIADTAAFEGGLADLYALPDLQADDTLQIMTIHKAKGLEFDTVIVPGLGRAPRADEPRLLAWMEQPGRGRAGGERLLLAPIRETGADEDPIQRWLRALEAEKERLESGRLLYVAATRAKRRLHLLGDVRLADGAAAAPGERTLLAQLWPMVKPVFDAAAARGPAAPAGAARGAAAVDQALRRLACGWRPPPPPPRVDWTPPHEPPRAQDAVEFSWAGETARHTGSVVHRWLQRIAQDGLARWDPARVHALRGLFRDQLVLCGLARGESEAAAARVAAALVQTLADERGRWLLGARDEAQSELRLTGVGAEGVVDVAIDRTFVDEQGVRWIVDYKTGGHEGGDVEAFLDRERERYRPQLERYAALLGAADPRPLRLGLYFPMLRGWREWRYRDDAGGSQ